MNHAAAQEAEAPIIARVGSSRVLYERPQELDGPPGGSALPTMQMSAISPDNTLVAYTAPARTLDNLTVPEDVANQRHVDVYTVDIATGEQTALTQRTGEAMGHSKLTWSYDGDRLYFAAQNFNNGLVTVEYVDLASGEQATVTRLRTDQQLVGLYANAQPDAFVPQLLDPLTGQSTAIDPTLYPALMSRNAPETSLRVVLSTFFPGDDMWHITDVDGFDLASLGSAMSVTDVAITPDGRSVAYLDTGKIVVWQDGVTRELDFKADMIAWGAVTYTFAPVIFRGS